MEYTEEKYKLLLKHINKYRILIKMDDFEKIFEPLQFLITDPDDAIVKIKDNNDLKSWQKEISYSFLVKINTIENAILNCMDQNDVYTASILIRHHMEQCGYISLAMEKLLEFIKIGSYDSFEKYLAKTLFGSPLSNNKKFVTIQPGYLKK
jgi:hypothetical protein